MRMRGECIYKLSSSCASIRQQAPRTPRGSLAASPCQLRTPPLAAQADTIMRETLEAQQVVPACRLHAHADPLAPAASHSVLEESLSVDTSFSHP